MTYHLKISEIAKKDIRQLPGNVRQRIRKVVNGLSADPIPRVRRKTGPETYEDIE